MKKMIGREFVGSFDFFCIVTFVGGKDKVFRYRRVDINTTFAKER